MVGFAGGFQSPFGITEVPALGGTVTSGGTGLGGAQQRNANPPATPIQPTTQQAGGATGLNALNQSQLFASTPRLLQQAGSTQPITPYPQVQQTQGNNPLNAIQQIQRALQLQPNPTLPNTLPGLQQLPVRQRPIFLR